MTNLLSLDQRKSTLSLAIFSVLVLFAVRSEAQQWEIGGGLGGMNYKGDVATALKPRFSRLGGNLFVRYNAGRAVSLKANLLFGNIFAEDRASEDPLQLARNHSFHTHLTEFSPQFEYNFLNFRNDRSRQVWTPYLFMGLALLNFRPEENKSPPYRLTQVTVPFGAGVKVVLRGNWNLGLEFGARTTFTDYLDDLGGPLTNNPLQNGNPTSKDMYFYTGLMISYTFYQVHCPDFY